VEDKFEERDLKIVIYDDANGKRQRVLADGVNQVYFQIMGNGAVGRSLQ